MAEYTHVGPGLPPLHGARANALIQKLGVRAVFCNGAASGRIYAKYAEPLTHLPAAVLPSTSPANAACRPETLREVWGEALKDYITVSNL